MNSEKRRALWRTALAVILGVFGLPVGPPVLPVAEASDNCFSTHTSGSGAGLMRICISDHGNLAQLESPDGVEHIGIGQLAEGYILCTAPNGTDFAHGFDSGAWEDGFAAPTISQPNGPNTFPLTITRNTTDGAFRLEQQFFRDAAERDVVIQMKVTNISGTLQQNVRITRYFDARLNNFNTQESYAYAQHSVWAWPTGFTNAAEALLLTPLTLNVPFHGPNLETLTDWDPGGLPGNGRFRCVLLNDAGSGPTPHGDFVGRIFHIVGTLNPGQSRTVKVQYRLF